MNAVSGRESRQCLNGVLIGTAVGDSLGLPAEGLSSRRTQRLFGGTWRQRFFLGRGMVSDDTEHTVFVAQALLSCSDSAAQFRRSLAWKLRLWLLCLPSAVGKATLRSIIKLWIGFSSERSGVYSAGNGPAMRSAIIGSYFAGSSESISAFVTASTRITHTDPRALTGALAVAHLSGWIVRNDSAGDVPVPEIFLLLRDVGTPTDEEWRETIDKMESAFEDQCSVQELAARMRLSKGVTGYTYHTVPVAIYSWLMHYGDFRATLESALSCGGDTDTVGAIAGALAGASMGEKGIPTEWVERIMDWPLSTEFLKKLAACLAERQAGRASALMIGSLWPGLLPRNIVFLLLVLMHGIRRLAPPY